MNVIASTGTADLATVYIARVSENKYIEFVESLQPPYPKSKKWVLIVSTLFGCPVGCKFCDCAGFYKGKLNKEQILEQIDYLVIKDYPDRIIPIDKFKIQFARMGEPALNDAVLDAIEELPQLYNAPGLIPSISTIAPIGRELFFERLQSIKEKHFGNRFQMQFSIHTTNPEKRDWLIPCKKWNFLQIADYGESFYQAGERKITLNFALGDDIDINTDILIKYFNPEIFLIKITPVNPTIKAIENSFTTFVEPNNEILRLNEKLIETGYEVIISIGEIEENAIGSNCGMYLMNYLKSGQKPENSYVYPINGQIELV